MKFDKEKMRLYAITDRHWLNGRSLKEVVKESVSVKKSTVAKETTTAEEDLFDEEESDDDVIAVVVIWGVDV